MNKHLIEPWGGFQCIIEGSCILGKPPWLDLVYLLYHVSSRIHLLLRMVPAFSKNVDMDIRHRYSLLPKR